MNQRMVVIVFASLLMAPTLSAGRQCNQELIKNLFSTPQMGPKESVSMTLLMKDLCPSLGESCCSDEQASFFIEGTRNYFNFGQDFNSRMEPLKAYLSYSVGKKNVFTAYPADMFPENCMPSSSYTPFAETTLKANDIGYFQRWNVKLAGSFACLACSAEFSQQVKLEGKKITTIPLRKRNVKYFTDVLSRAMPYYSFFDGKFNHIEAMKCMKGAKPKFIDTSEDINEILYIMNKYTESFRLMPATFIPELAQKLNDYFQFPAGLKLSEFGNKLKTLHEFSLQNSPAEDGKTTLTPQVKDNKEGPVVLDNGSANADGKTAAEFHPIQKFGYDFDSKAGYDFNSMKIVFDDDGLDLSSYEINEKYYSRVSLLSLFAALLLFWLL